MQLGANFQMAPVDGRNITNWSPAHAHPDKVAHETEVSAGTLRSLGGKER